MNKTELIAAMADKAAISKKDAEAALNKAIAQVGSKAKFNEILKQYGVSLAEFKKIMNIN